MEDLEMDKPILQRALEHYKTRLKETGEDPEIKFQKIKDDITTQTGVIQKRIDDLENIVNIGSLGDGEYRKDVCLALSCYVEDLQESIENTKSKLNNLNIDFKQTQKEIDLAKKACNRYCPNDWSPKE